MHTHRGKHSSQRKERFNLTEDPYTVQVPSSIMVATETFHGEVRMKSYSARFQQSDWFKLLESDPKAVIFTCLNTVKLWGNRSFMTIIKTKLEGTATSNSFAKSLSFAKHLRLLLREWVLVTGKPCSGKSLGKKGS